MLVVTDLSFQAAVMAQIEYFTVGENSNDNTQEKKLHWLSIFTFLIKKKKAFKPNLLKIQL
jgi:hypothetical protein